MAYAADHTTSPSALTRFFKGVLETLARRAENSPKMRQVALLSSLSDEQLAAKGLTRDDIGRAVLNASGWV